MHALYVASEAMSVFFKWLNEVMMKKYREGRVFYWNNILLKEWHNCNQRFIWWRMYLIFTVSVRLPCHFFYSRLCQEHLVSNNSIMCTVLPKHWNIYIEAHCVHEIIGNALMFKQIVQSNIMLKWGHWKIFIVFCIPLMKNKIGFQIWNWVWNIFL